MMMVVYTCHLSVPVGNRDLQESEMYRMVYTYQAKIVIDLAEMAKKPITDFALFANT